MTDLQEHIDHIMDHFDFDRVEKVMEALNWKWFRASTEDGIPDKSDLRKEARRLLKSAWEYGMKINGDWWVSTGGFTAKFSWENNKPFLRLVFVVEDTRSEYI